MTVHDDVEDSDDSAPPQLVLHVGQRVSDIYTILDKREPDVIPSAPTPVIAEPLGQGGSGTVYLASYRGMQKRAIKFLTLNYLSGSTGKRPSDFQKTFNRERVFLSTLSHGNIARLYDTESFVDPQDIEWQYIVTDYIDGDELLPALKRVSGQQVYNAISDVLRAVVYMHSKKVLHADIKWENIRCRETPTGVEAVILDLGTAHYVPDEHSGQVQLPLDHELNTRVRFITTRRITHERHREYRNGIVDKETLRQLFPYHDIHALGVLLGELVADAEVRHKLLFEIGPEGLSALKTMIYNLLKSPEGSPTQESRDYRRVIVYTSVQQVYRDWQKLRKTYLAPVNVPELSLAAEFKYSVPTAVGRSVVTPRLSKLVNHKLFQRLRRIPQLEMTMLKFPGATHTRLSHSLAVLRNTRYYIAHLLNDPNFRLLAEQEDLQATVLLALLHDVGHYQLSHMFEDFASAQRSAKRDASWQGIDFDIPTDDDLFWCIIEPSRPVALRGDYGKHIEEAWRSSEDELELTRSESLADIIREEFGVATYEAMLRIHNAIYRPGEYEKPAVAQLVLGAVLSSDIDADKVSYLIEDAARSGVNYGSGVDFDGLLGALRMPDASNIDDRPTLGITQKGIAAAQSVAVSRNLMVGQVYWQHTNRAATAMVKYVVARMLQAGTLDMPTYIKTTLFREYDSSLKYLFQAFEEIRKESAQSEVNPIAGLLDSERRVYDTAFSTSRLDRDRGEHIGEALTRKSFSDILMLESNVLEAVRAIPGLKGIKDGEVLVDVPIKERERPSGDRGGQVFVYETRTSTEGVSLRTATPFLNAIREQHLRENRVCRVFVSPMISHADRYQDVMAAVKRYILDEYA